MLLFKDNVYNIMGGNHVEICFVSFPKKVFFKRKEL